MRASRRVLARKATLLCSLRRASLPADRRATGGQVTERPGCPFLRIRRLAALAAITAAAILSASARWAGSPLHAWRGYSSCATSDEVTASRLRRLAWRRCRAEQQLDRAAACVVGGGGGRRAASTAQCAAIDRRHSMIAVAWLIRMPPTTRSARRRRRHGRHADRRNPPPPTAKQTAWQLLAFCCCCGVVSSSDDDEEGRHVVHPHVINELYCVIITYNAARAYGSSCMPGVAAGGEQRSRHQERVGPAPPPFTPLRPQQRRRRPSSRPPWPSASWAAASSRPASPLPLPPEPPLPPGASPAAAGPCTT